MIRRIKISLDDRDADDAEVLAFIDDLAGLSKARRGAALRRLLYCAVQGSSSETEMRPVASPFVRVVKPAKPRVAQAPKAELVRIIERLEMGVPVMEVAEPPMQVTPGPVLPPVSMEPEPRIVALTVDEQIPADRTPRPTVRKPSLAMW